MYERGAGWGLSFDSSDSIGAGRLSGNRNAASDGGRLGYGIAVLAHRFQMNLHRAADEFGRFFERRSGGDAAWKIRNIGAVAGAGFLVDDREVHRFRPACTRILRNVFGAASAEGCPAIVTFPDLVACS